MYNELYYILPFIFTKRHFAAPLKESNKFFVKKNLKFGIRENMSHKDDKIF